MSSKARSILPSFNNLATFFFVTILAIVLNPMSSDPTKKKEVERVDASTIQGKFMVGYQGWFFCPGDGVPLHPKHHGWLHWQNHPITDGGKITFDMWPSTRELDPDELYDVPGLTNPITGRPAQLFSSRHPKTVRRHFKWMREHDIPGVFLQRFLGQVNKGDDSMRRQRDEIGLRVRESAEAEGRVWAMMWDVSGVKGENVEADLITDWKHMVHDQKILTSPSYLHEDGRPVVVIWGLGFARRNHDPKNLIRFIQWLRASVPGGVWVMAGTPTNWHSAMDDADPDETFMELWDEFDAISPWAVGRYSTPEAADNYDRVRTRRDQKVIEERDAAKGKKQRDYVPVVFPGFSWKNLHDGPLNQMPRLGGEFLYRQLYNARKSGASVVYGAMFDEYDEATALMPSEPHSSHVPKERDFLALDADGESLPDDWFLRICSVASKALLAGEQLPENLPRKQLENFWDDKKKESDSPSS
ncbi:hypothetical protein BDY24DRAFT_412339 [Mrakia frigida]|uniref:glycoside hydrolase family 71/99-like protein n=1 Tax=Mrakia frigida TaxID=29902 RepID=UPI003FCC0CCE